MKKLFWLFGTILFAGGVFQVQGQYAPPAGQAGSTAIAVDSSVFVAWAQHCEIARGYMDITQPGQGVAGYGTLENALGVADNYVVSLGDGGEAVYSLTSLYMTVPELILQFSKMPSMIPFSNWLLWL